MTQLAAWLAVCLGVAWFFRSRPVHALALVVLLWTALPAVAGYRLTGQTTGSFAFHPATWLVLAIFVLQLTLRPAKLAAAVSRHTLLFVVVTIFTIGAFLTSRVGNSGGTRLMFDQIIGPFLLFWLVVAFAHEDRRVGLVLRNAIIFAAAAESVLAIIQKGTGSIIFYLDDYSRLYWFNPETFERWMGTTDSPLVFSLAVCIAGALTLGLKNWVLRFTLLFLFLIGTLITQSRTGTALMCVIILYSILRSHMVVWARALTALAVVITGYYIATSTLVSGLTERLTNDTGSADARIRALRFVFENWNGYLATGFGLTSSYAIARDSGLRTSLESSYLMYVVDVGLILATAYFGAQIALLVRYGRQRAYLGVTFAAVVGVLLQHSFSGVAGTNLAGTYIWATLAMMVVGKTVMDAERARAIATTAPDPPAIPRRNGRPHPHPAPDDLRRPAADADKEITSASV